MPYPISAVHSRRFVAAYADRMRMLFGASLIGYWPLWEASGATATDISPQANNGTYSNVTLAQAGIGDGRTSAQFVAASGSYLNVLTAGLVADFNGAEFTFAIWANMANWADGTERMLLYLRDGAYDDYIYINKYFDPDRFLFNREANGTVKNVTIAVTGSGWKHIAGVVSEAGDYTRLYVNGVSVGTPTSSIGTYADDPTFWDIGASDAHTVPWNGYLAHAILLNRAATAPEIAEAARASV